MFISMTPPIASAFHLYRDGADLIIVEAQLNWDDGRPRPLRLRRGGGLTNDLFS